MKRFLAAAVFLVSMLGCATPAPTQQQVADAGDVVLILAPQGVDPGIDTVGFNALVKKLTQGFSSQLATALQASGKQPVNVLDQSTKLNIGEKLSLYSIKHRAKTAIVLTVESEKVGDDEQLKLQVQYVDQTFIVDDGTVHGVKPTATVSRAYFLRGSQSGDDPQAMRDLSDDFVSALKASGRL